jgi:twinkle protein
MKDYQGFIFASLLMGVADEYINQIDPLGFDGYGKALFADIKRVYDNVGAVEIDKLSIGISRAVEIMDNYNYMSLSMDACIRKLKEDAYYNQVDFITERLRKGNLDIDSTIEELKSIKQTETDMLIDVSELKYKSLDELGQETIETGFYEYDSHINDWKLGELSIIFGRNGEGKTTLISQVIGHCISRGTKTFLYSGEMSDNKIQDWLYRQIVGSGKEYYKKFVTKYGFKNELKSNVIDALKEWHKDTLFLYNRNAKKKVKNEIDRLFTTMEIAINKGVKLFIIDNLMAILEENADSLYSDQANFVQRCKNFAVNNNIHIVLMAHPNKEKKELAAEVGNLDKTDISGSNNIPNKADNIISIERIWSDERVADAIVTSLKDRETGQRKVMKFLFSVETLRFYNDVTKQKVNYGWTKHLKPTEKTAKFYNGYKQTFKDGELGDDWS